MSSPNSPVTSPQSSSGKPEFHSTLTISKIKKASLLYLKHPLCRIASNPRLSLALLLLPNAAMPFLLHQPTFAPFFPFFFNLRISPSLLVVVTCVSPLTPCLHPTHSSLRHNPPRVSLNFTQPSLFLR